MDLTKIREKHRREVIAYRRAYRFTGSTTGPLNKLSGDAGISDPKRSVSATALAVKHNAKSESELADLIDYHYHNKCECGIVSTGTVRDFGVRLYEAQKTDKDWGDYYISLTECLKWEYCLFVTCTLKGNALENKAVKILPTHLKGCTVEKTDGYLDEEFRVDVLIKDTQDEDVCGIQVKPDSYKNVRESVRKFNIKLNEKWGKPVYYLYYDKEGEFMNLDETVKNCKENLKE